MQSEPIASMQPTSSPGKVLRVHLPRTDLLLRLRLLALLSALGAAGTGAAALWRLYDSYQNYGPALVARWTSPLFAVSGTLFLIFTMALLDLWKVRGFRAAICEQGFMLQKNKNRREIIRWETIEALYLKATRYMIPFLNHQNPLQVKIQSTGRKPVAIHTLEDMRSLIDAVKAQTYPRLLESYRLQIDKGGQLSMGPITLSGGELRVRKRHIAWDTVRHVRLEKGRVHLRLRLGTKDKKLRVPAHSIPNVDLCIQIIHHLGQIS